MSHTGDTHLYHVYAHVLHSLAEDYCEKMHMHSHDIWQCW